MVDLGPFKHQVDEGLEIRKVAFECMYTLLENCLELLDTPEFISHLVDGLNDVYDIKMLCHLMLVRIASSSGAALLEALDSLIEPLRATIQKKEKESAVKQEVDRNEELIRSALRAIAAISQIPSVDQQVKFCAFLMNVVQQGELGEKFEAIRGADADNDAVEAVTLQ